ncbi:MAG: glycogen synthase GlgA [Candidatus Omnitrophica bacterium]|nr:glycogen synthase GlgA [Candidatus Omnitrophota bacterium]
MRIVFAASEMYPFAKTGGLADVAGALPKALVALGHEVKVILPRFRSIDPSLFSMETIDEFEVMIGQQRHRVEIKAHEMAPRLKVYFVEHPGFFDRESLYSDGSGDYPDNDQRFICFSKAVPEILRRLEYQPDVIHCHDWQTGLIPAYLKCTYQKQGLFEKCRTIFTVHNLAYQGNFPLDTFPLTGFGWEEFTLHRMEFYGKVSFLKAGLVYSDVLTTVSPNYAHEIQTEEFGSGMDGILRERALDLYGIVNGIDVKEWDPQTDQALAANYGASTMIRKKPVNKAFLQKENDLEVNPKIPVIGMVTRLVEQKGIDTVAAILEPLEKARIQLVLLGSGSSRYQSLFTKIAGQYTGHFSFHLKYDEKLSRRIYAGSDFFLMPSLFEPCGLGQMIALRYGALPIVRSVGGLADTVTDYHQDSESGNGFVYEGSTAQDLLGAIDRAVQVFGDKKLWTALQKNAMKCDFSWKVSAEKYIELYKHARRKTALR